MPRSLIGRLAAVLALLIAAGLASGAVTWSLFEPSMTARIGTAVRAALPGSGPGLARHDAPSGTLPIASCPLPGLIPAPCGWTMTRVRGFPGGVDLAVTAGLGVLSVALACASSLIVLLMVTWRRHVARIAAAFARADDGPPRFEPTGERELDRIVLAMNEAGTRLARSREETQALSLRVAEAERLAAVGRVAGGIAHEIRNPIAAMRLKAETALHGPADRKDRALHLVIDQVDRLDALVRRLLAAAERSCPHLEDVALGRFLEACAAAQAPADGPAVRVVCGPAVARLDPDQMRRALDGLLANAVEAAAGGPVTLRADRQGDTLVLAVSDGGRGPPVEIEATTFEPFVTGHPERAGLGLSIAREIAHTHGGDVRFGREDGLTTFRIEVPWLAS